jgi:2-polyprenyl-3-methyl-5-hydroxy-6-metoxy-1,4-benzoquinol methylase
VSRCCRLDAYREIFDEKQARKDARRYRRKGLPKDAAAGVAFLRRRGVGGLTVLEVGGGVGAAALELLRAGASGAVNVELSPAYAPVAAELMRAEGLDESAVEFRVGDFVDEASAIEPADVVVMNRVVCCYPDHQALLSAAAERARRYFVFTYPRDNQAARLAVRLMNLVLRLSGKEFRGFVHSRAAMFAVAEGRGLRLAEERRAPIWQTAALERLA